MLRNDIVGGCVSFPGIKRYEGVRFSVISFTMSGGGQIPWKQALCNT